MTKEIETPCAALFDMMKRYGKISYKELASLILSGNPLSDGVSPVSRVNDRAWLSRYIVNAPVGSIHESYFAEFSSAALRVVARLKTNKRNPLSSKQILDLVVGERGQEMVDALAACHQDVSLYRNVLDRLASESGFTENERAEMAVVLLVTAGCSADVRAAASQVLKFSKAVHGAGMATPLATPSRHQELAKSARDQRMNRADQVMQPALVLMRVVDGYITGVPHWISRDEAGVEIGSLTLAEGAITDVGSDVSGRHLLIHCDGGEWYARGLDSKYGTVLISGIDQSERTIEAPRDERADGEAALDVPINPGDELLLASNTRFMIMEGIAPE